VLCFGCLFFGGSKSLTGVRVKVKLLSDFRFLLREKFFMKILLSWLNDYIKTGLGAEETAEVLSDLGFPCEGIEGSGKEAVIDVEITSNRGDCLGYIGIARELSAVTGKKVEIPDVVLEEAGKEVDALASVEILEPGLCGRYTARVIEGVKVGASPGWLVKRLKAVGMRSVNNVVDATNYAMYETGQPPHAFDYDKLNDGTIIVRKAKPGERIVSIDGSKFELDSDMLIIADSKVPVAIAGVMGGLDTEVSDGTQRVLLEDAYFDPVCVRETSRKLALASEAAFRFERIVDIENIEWSSRRTAQLIIQLAGGASAAGVVDEYPEKWEQRGVTLRFSRLKRILGIEVPREEVVKILAGLSFEPRLDGDKVVCSVPSWRGDVSREADLIEEVSRVYGYKKIPTEERIEIEVASVDERGKVIDKIGSYLNGCGFYESVNVSFVDERMADLFTVFGSGSHLLVKGASVKGTNLLRQNLLGSLFGVVKTNLNAGNRPCRLFEISRTFEPGEGKDEDLPQERTKIGLVSDSGFRELRGVIEGLVKDINHSADVFFKPTELVWSAVGAKIEVNGDSIGEAGIVNQSVKDEFDFKDVEPVGAELSFEGLLGLREGVFEVKALPRFPAIDRDLSLILEEGIRWEAIVDIIKGKSPEELEEIKFVEIYRGENIPAGSKSVHLSLRFRGKSGTLKHERVDSFEAEIVKSLRDSIGAELRTV